MSSSKFIDPSVKRKRKTLDDLLQTHGETPLFGQVEFNMLGSCNRKCSFCPVSNHDFYEKNDRYAKFDIELYKRIVSQLGELNYRGIIVYSGLSEPLLLKNIYGYLEITKEHAPGVQLQLVTNGDVLTVERLARLFDSGLDVLLISMYDGPEQIEKFNSLVRSAEVDPSSVILRRRFLQDGNYGITFSNRTGLINPESGDQTQKQEAISLPLNQPCFYPFYSLKVNYNGDVTMCSHDWDSRLIVGNLREQHILEVWSGEIISDARSKLKNSDRRFPPCETCDVDGLLVGKKHFSLW